MSRKTSLLLASVAVLMGTNISAQAALENATLKSIDNQGTYQDNSNGYQFNINNSGNTTIKWDKFNVGVNEKVDYNFIQQNSTAINQINTIGGASTIAGQINAIGAGAATSNIVINNAAGVSFINGAVVNVAGMTVDTGNSLLEINSLRVLDGNLKFNTSKGTINIDGISYDKKGNLTVRSTGGDINISNVNNVDGLDLQTSKNIYIKDNSATTIGGETVKGITADYIKLASTNNGRISVAGKVTVGKDFIAITNGRFLGENENTSKACIINTPHGVVYSTGFGGNGKSDIKNAQVVSKNGFIKILAGDLTVEDSNVNNFIATSNNFKLINSNISDNLAVAVDGTHNNDTPTTIINSTVNNMQMEYSNLKLQNANINNLDSIGVEVNNIVQNETDSVNIGNLNVIGGSIKFDSNVTLGKLAASNSSKIYLDGVNLIDKAVKCDNVKELNVKNLGSFELTDGSSFANNITVKFNNTDLTMNGVKAANSGITIDNGNVIANNVDFKSITNKDGNLTLNNSTVTHLTASNTDTTPVGEVNISNTTIKGNLNITNYDKANLDNITSTNGGNYNNINDVKISNSEKVSIHSGTINNNLTLENSGVSTRVLKVGNEINATNCSKLTFDQTTYAKNLNVKDSILDTTKSARISGDVTVTNDVTGADITSAEVYAYSKMITNKDNGSLYLGSSNYTGNIDASGNVNKTALVIETKGDVNLNNVYDIKALTINNSQNTTISNVKGLWANKIVAQDKIDITTGSLKNAISDVGTIDSKSANINLNLDEKYDVIGIDTDANNRQFTNIQSVGNFNVYNVEAAPQPIIPEVITTNTNVANVEITSDTSTSSTVLASLKVAPTDNVPNISIQNSNQSLATQFSRNVKSLAADDKTSEQEAKLSKIDNGFKIQKPYKPAMNK